RGPTRAFSPPPPPSLVHLLGEVLRLAELLDQVELRLQPVDMLLLVFEHVLEEIAGRVVALRDAERDGLVQLHHRLALERQVVLQLLRYRFADTEPAELLEIRDAFEKEDAL